MFERLAAIDARLTDAQKKSVGAVGLLAGVALLALLLTGTSSSTPVQVVLGLLAVLLMVVGTLALGTTDTGDRPV